MDSGDHIHFSTQFEEIQYLKDFVQRLMNEKDALQMEFDDYTSSSEQLEKEYEATIEQNEKTIKDLRSMHHREQKEKDSLKLKLEQTVHENEQLQSEAEHLKEEKLQLQRTVRILEQKNDDLERAERMRAETVAAFESSLNNAIERNAILESEIDEKESLKEKLQRLVDETRDLKQELHIKERCPDNERLLNRPPPPPTMAVNGNENGLPTASRAFVDSNRLKVECETQTTPTKRETTSKISLLDTPMTASSRVLALNIIGDLMRKIGLSRFLCEHCGQVKCTTFCQPPPARPSQFPSNSRPS
ncbi:nuclear distribution protein nudE-like 1-B isoform X2 [Atheta coriaria]|uniref:nuclear distribution protein nudE-like 1-B isoform X2 n=1 Tax=Dalotia coriaria TaxID=877792 RepID=UPI0031F34D96